MGETRGNPEHAVVFRRQFGAEPLAQGRRVAAQVHGDVKHRARSDPHQFALGVAGLVVQPAQDAPGGAAVIVLDEIQVKARLPEGSCIPAFQKEAPLVAKDPRLQQKYAG